MPCLCVVNDLTEARLQFLQPCPRVHAVNETAQEPHKHPAVQRWLRRHPRFHLHFTPTSCSWLNLVERWFRNLTQQRLRRGSFHNVKELIQAIGDYIRSHNQNPRVFVWSAPVARILTKVAKCKEALDALQ